MSVSQYIIAPAAQQDLIDIWSYIAAESLKRADKVIRTLEEKCEMLARNPRLGHVRRDLTSRPVRFWPVYNYLLIYRDQHFPLEIVRVLSGYRDLIELLD